MPIYPVSPKNETPLKYQIANHIRRQIREGIWEAGEQIPTEKELCERYKVSRITIVNALLILQGENLIERRQGKGTFVADFRINRSLSSRNSFSNDIRNLGFSSSIQLLECEMVKAPSRVAKELGIEKGSDMVRVKRLRFVEEEPVAITNSYLTLELGLDLLETADVQSLSLYQYLKTKTQETPEPGTLYIEPSLLTDEEAELLRTSPKSACCITYNVTMIAGEPVEFVQTILRGDRFRLSVEKICYDYTLRS